MNFLRIIAGRPGLRRLPRHRLDVLKTRRFPPVYHTTARLQMQGMFAGCPGREGLARRERSFGENRKSASDGLTIPPLFGTIIKAVIIRLPSYVHEKERPL
jgi:hypothetical protein